MSKLEPTRTGSIFLSPSPTIQLLVLAVALVLSVGEARAEACQPQCVAHARHSAKIFTRRVGSTRGAIDWFRLAEQEGATQTTKIEGKILLPLVLLPQRGLNRHFGHVIFVKTSKAVQTKKQYLITFSHTNYAGQCRLEHGLAYYFPQRLEVEFLNGAFQGRRFKAAGFITE